MYTHVKIWTLSPCYVHRPYQLCSHKIRPIRCNDEIMLTLKLVTGTSAIHSTHCPLSSIPKLYSVHSCPSQLYILSTECPLSSLLGLYTVRSVPGHRYLSWTQYTLSPVTSAQAYTVHSIPGHAYQSSVQYTASPVIGAQIVRSTQCPQSPVPQLHTVHSVFCHQSLSCTQDTVALVMDNLAKRK